MSLAITELELTDVNTITIPTDGILILSLLIIFALIGYLFHQILNNLTNQFVDNVDDNSIVELVKENLEDQLFLESTTVNQERVEKPTIKKLNLLPTSKLLSVRNIAVLTIGGASLLGIQTMHNAYQGMNTSQANIKNKNQSAKTFVSMVKLTTLDKDQNKIKKITYVDPFLSSINSSTDNNFNQFKARKTEDFFSF